MKLENKTRWKSKKLLLMGSSAFKARELPVEVKKRMDQAIEGGMTIIVGEAPGANRLYQDYLKVKGHRNVVVGHAVRLGITLATGRTFSMEKTSRKERGR